MTYLRRLEQLDTAGSLVRAADARLVLLTGQSSFVSAALSPEQEKFLCQVAPPGYEMLAAGFPFHRAMVPVGHQESSLLAASVRNTAQAAWSFCDARYRRVLRRILQELVERTHRELAIVTGSCGLQMANAVWPMLEIPAGLRPRVIALGPVCLRPLRLPGARVEVLQGERDIWSRIFYRGRVDHYVPCNHLDYWSSGTVRRTVADLLTS
jgi:hypothetical protein